MYLIILLISLVIGFMMKKIAYGFITEQSFLKRSFWRSFSEMKLVTDQREYIVLQIILSVITMTLYFQYALSFIFVKFLFLTTMMLLIGYIDFKTTYVYRFTTAVTGVGGVVFLFLESFLSKSWPIDSLLGCFIGFAIIGLIVVLTRGMGEGDIEIAALCGLFLGASNSFLAVFLGIVLGGIGGTVLLARRSKGLKDEMAFGPYLVLGAFIAMLVGDSLVEYYLNFFI